MKPLFILIAITIGIGIGISIMQAQAFTDNPSIPPSNNTPAPLNEGTTNQTKQGFIQSNSNLRAPLFFDSSNTDYYLDPSGTSRVSNVIQRNASPTLYLQDTNARTGMLQVNDNFFYVLRGCGADSTATCQLNGRWPLAINLDTNDAIFGGELEVDDVFLRSVGRYASDVASISTSIYTIPLSDSASSQTVSAQYCAISSQASHTFSYYDLDSVRCTATQQSTNQWELYGRASDIDRSDVMTCQFSCID